MRCALPLAGQEVNSLFERSFITRLWIIITALAYLNGEFLADELLGIQFFVWLSVNASLSKQANDGRHTSGGLVKPVREVARFILKADGKERNSFILACSLVNGGDGNRLLAIRQKSLILSLFDCDFHTAFYILFVI